MIFLDDVRVCFGVLENLCTETVLYKFYQLGPGRCADARTCGRERNDEFSVFVHNAERPDGTVEGFIFGLQDAAAIWVQERAGNFFFGVGGAVAAKNYLTVAELPHHAVFIGLAEFFDDFGRKQWRFPEALPAERAAELACGALAFGENRRKHYSPTTTWHLSRTVCG